MFCVVPTSQAARTEATRRKLLDAAFNEVFHRGYQAASLNDIAAAAGATKGALFHHFDGKQALGYALVDDVLASVLNQRWLAPLAEGEDPITTLQNSFRRHIRDDITSGNLIYGCPMNNLAQEMSPLDEGFRVRFDAMYETWRRTIADALERGQRAGRVLKKVDACAAATLIVVGQIGIWSTAKHSRNAKLMTEAGEAICAALETLRAGRPPSTRRVKAVRGARAARRAPSARGRSGKS
jgi:TetR/AcrR family transcriptional repressor of nem operon